jgi:type VI secretion system secreted protein VgrG
MATGRLHFALQAGPLAEADLVVSGLEGYEGLSQPYDLQVEFLRRDGAEVDLEAVVGQEAELTLRRPSGEQRVFHGEAHRVELVGVAAGQPRYRLSIRPRLARLARVRHSRIFQDQSVPDIVAAVLDEHGVAHRSALAGSPPVRPFTVQYRETDLAFVSRLLEDEGLWYRFEHGPGRHELVLADAPSGHASGGGELPVRPRTGQGDDAEHAFRVTRSHRSEPGSVTLRDFDFERPALDLTARRDEAGEPEVYDWPGGFLQPGEGTARARQRLEGLRHGLATLEAETTCLGLLPGADFELTGHGKLLAVRLRHHGKQELAPGGTGPVAASYQNAVEAIEASLPYRPRRRTPAPRLAGIQTATVVTPSGEEVHTDQHGRLKVRFHWDREGPGDERASCWVRVSQAWAGAGMGASVLPRAGQEVVVRFLDGDLDRPLVTGAVYNGQNPPPLALPGDKTQATTRSDSSPGGGGSNELRFEDLKDQEEILHHAERDQAVVVEHDHGRLVRAHEALQVEKDRSRQVAGEQTLAVAGPDAGEIGGSSTLTVAGERTTAVVGFHEEKVGGSQVVTVAGSQHVTVRAAKAVFVGAAAALNVGGAYAVSVAGVHNTAVGGLKGTEVGGAWLEFVGGQRDEQVGTDRQSSTGGAVELNVDGMMTLSTGADVEEQVGGEAGLEVKGSITLLMKNGTFQADGLKLVVGGKVALSMAKGGDVTLAGTSISLDGATIETKGSKIGKVSGQGASGGSATVAALQRPDDPRAVVLVTVLDADGQPVVNEPFKVELPDGAVKHGRTDGSGKAAIPGGKAGTAKVTFTNLDEKLVEES